MKKSSQSIKKKLKKNKRKKLKQIKLWLMVTWKKISWHNKKIYKENFLKMIYNLIFKNQKNFWIDILCLKYLKINRKKFKQKKLRHLVPLKKILQHNRKIFKENFLKVVYNLIFKIQNQRNRKINKNILYLKLPHFN